MHECPWCYQACDCDGEDTWNGYGADECVCDCDPDADDYHLDDDCGGYSGPRRPRRDPVRAARKRAYRRQRRFERLTRDGFVPDGAMRERVLARAWARVDAERRRRSKRHHIHIRRRPLNPGELPF